MSESIDFGIKYDVIKLKDNLFFLVPVELVEGYATTTNFYTDSEYRVLSSPTDLAGEYVVDTVFSGDNLRQLYEMDDLNFLKEYFLAEEKDRIQVVLVSKGKMKKFKVDARMFEEANVLETFQVEQGKPMVTLNETALEDVLSSESVDEMRAKLLRYKSLIKNIKERERKDGTTKITVKNGTITEIVSRNKVTDLKANDTLCKTTSANVADKGSMLGADVSLRGLETYIRERVFGHDKEIRKLSKTIIMNATALEGEKNEPILLLGPTGTGKTETVHAICGYLSIPLVEVNSVNLVPQGIKGMSLEDCLYSLIVSCNYDVKKAQKGLVFFDEFDKLGLVSSDYKSPVSQILLKFIEGSHFLVDKPTDDYDFDTSMLIKIFAGAFTDLFGPDKSIGFSSGDKKGSTFKPKNITEKEYFGKELVTRIPHIVLFDELSREDKRRAILYSKVSEFLIKKERYERQFGVTLSASDAYIEALLDKLDREQRSMRDINNLIIESLDEAEYEMLSQDGNYKRLVLTSDTVSDNTKFDLS